MIATRPIFPFSAIVGQEQMKLALICTAVDPSIGGVLVFGDRGTGKSTAIRALAALLPPMRAVVGCRYACDPADPDAWCAECRERAAAGTLKERIEEVATAFPDQPAVQQGVAFLREGGERAICTPRAGREDEA